MFPRHAMVSLFVVLAVLVGGPVCTPAAAQPDSLAFVDFSVSLGHFVWGPDYEEWRSGVAVYVFDPKGGDNISRVQAINPMGVVKELTPETGDLLHDWDVSGDYIRAGLIFPVTEAYPPLAWFGSYQITVWNRDGDSASVTSTETKHVSVVAPAFLWPTTGAILTDTQPTFSWEPAPWVATEPDPIVWYAIDVWSGATEEWAAGTMGVWCRITDEGDPLSVRFNDDGMAGIPELTPGNRYDLGLHQYETVCLDPGGDGRPAEYYTDESFRCIDITIASSSLTSFEEDRYPWAGFAAGPGDAATWREPFTPEGAHSATFAMHGETDGEAITGLRLALPVGPTNPAGASLRSWAYVPEWTGTDSSCFFGFSPTEDYPNSTAGWSQAIGWEALSATQSNLQLGGTSIALPLGLPAAGWHLVRVNYHRAADSLRVWLDGVLVVDEVDIGAAGQAPHCAVLGAVGQSAAAQ